MSRSPSLEATIGAYLSCALLVGGLRWMRSGVGESATAPMEMSWTFTRVARDLPSAEPESEEALRDRNPFRFSRLMATLRPGDTPAPVALPGPLYRPALSLKGIVGGPPWTALVAGIPGRPEPRLLAVRDRADSLLVLSIGSDSVVISGPDTSWILRLGRGRP